MNENQEVKAGEVTEKKPRPKRKRTSIVDKRIINSEKMIQSGMLQELNRLFFHPLGIDMRPLKSGKCSSFVFVDMVDSVEDVRLNLGRNVKKALEFAAAFQEFTNARKGLRRRAVGFVKQSLKPDA